MFMKNNNCNCCNMNNNNDNDIMEELLSVEESCNKFPNLPAFDDNADDDCECGFGDNETSFPDNLTLAQSYVPIQQLNKTFKPCAGLDKGTLFPELVSPYRPCQSIEEIEFIKATNTIGKGCNG